MEMEVYMSKKCIILIIFSSLIILFSSCYLSQVENTPPEYSISQPDFKNGVTEYCCELGGVSFDFYNKSEKSIIYLEVKMNIYDSSTKENAFIGVGTITSSIDCHISFREKKNFFISLDKYITVIPNNELYIDQFYVSKIIYDDGSEWNDYFGVYVTASEQ